VQQVGRESGWSVLRKDLSRLYAIGAESFRPRKEWLVEQLLTQVAGLVEQLEALGGLTPEVQMEWANLKALSQELGFHLFSPWVLRLECQLFGHWELHGEGTAAAKRWYRAAQTALYQGHAERLAQEVEEMASAHPEEIAAELQKEAGYLDKHKRRMQYLEMCEEGYVIGSGMVESGGKRFKSRFCGSRMRWSRAGIERLIPIRAAVMSNRFDTMWEAAYNSPQL
jgi:hypothetical protein